MSWWSLWNRTRRRKPPAPPQPVPVGEVVKAFDTASAASAQWFRDAYTAGFRLFIVDATNVDRSGGRTAWKFTSEQLGYALDAGLKVAAYSRDPRLWRIAINACRPYINKLQFFCLDVETDPGVAVTREMVDGVKSMGIRPLIYSGWGMWPDIMGKSTEFADLPLWDVDAENARWDALTYVPSLIDPKPVAYGGWNTPDNPRVGVQQTWDARLNGIDIDVCSFAASFLIDK